MNQLETPILFLAFNRPAQTSRVFESIRAVRPKRLYIAIDGPRIGRADDITNREEVLSIVKNIDWPCKAKYLIHEENKGCSLSGYLAWKWFFDYEDHMIFIEDDGLGNESAFRFMEDMLERYADDSRIAYVGGVNYGLKFGNASYFFSRPPAATYFMGTWKRVFEKYEYEVESFRKNRFSLKFIKHFNTITEYLVITSSINQYLESILKGNRLSTYDQQMIYLSYKYDMYSIYPNVNMVSNIGLDEGANNHYSKDDPFYIEYGNRQRKDLDTLVHPSNFMIDRKFEKIFFKKRCLYNKPWFGNWIRVNMPSSIRYSLSYLKHLIWKIKK